MALTRPKFNRNLFSLEPIKYPNFIVKKIDNSDFKTDIHLDSIGFTFSIKKLTYPQKELLFDFSFESPSKADHVKQIIDIITAFNQDAWSVTNVLWVTPKCFIIATRRINTDTNLILYIPEFIKIKYKNGNLFKLKEVHGDLLWYYAFMDGKLNMKHVLKHLKLNKRQIHSWLNEKDKKTYKRFIKNLEQIFPEAYKIEVEREEALEKWIYHYEF